MSVYISNFDNADGTWTVTHDDAPDGHHSGQIQPTDVVRARNMDDSLNENFATVVCRGWGAAAAGAGDVHPPDDARWLLRGRLPWRAARGELSGRARPREGARRGHGRRRPLASRTTATARVS